MDIKEKIEEIVSKVQNNEGFADDFKKNPVKAIESILGINLPDDQINAIVEGVKAKVSLDKAGDVLDSLKKLF
ncbi:MAG: hypothetical protein LCH34_14605 [Firmicutes bacterium]|nr:hypothetical protein [Bacillota bacterium]